MSNKRKSFAYHLSLITHHFFIMAVLKKIRSRWWSQAEEAAEPVAGYDAVDASPILEVHYDVL
jgi:hypothetical protein